jgi:hypothetical protein
VRTTNVTEPLQAVCHFTHILSVVGRLSFSGKEREMSRREWTVMAGTALATMVVGVVLFGTFAGIAEGPNAAQKAEIKWPEMKVGDCDLRLRMTKDTYSPGESPVIEIDVTNSSSLTTTLEGTLTMYAQDPGSYRSRMPVMPQPLKVMPVSLSPVSGVTLSVNGERVTERKVAMAVDGNEVTCFVFPLETKVPAGRSIFITLKIGNKSVSTIPFGSPLAGLAPAPVQTPFVSLQAPQRDALQQSR